MDGERAAAEEFRRESHEKMARLQQTTVDVLTNNVQTLTGAVNALVQQGLNQQQVERTAQAPPAVPTAVGAEDRHIGEFFFVFFVVTNPITASPTNPPQESINDALCPSEIPPSIPSKMPGSFELLSREWENMDLGHQRHSYLSELTSSKVQAWQKREYLIDYLMKINAEDLTGATMEDTAKKQDQERAKLSLSQFYSELKATDGNAQRRRPRSEFFYFILFCSVAFFLTSCAGQEAALPSQRRPRLEF